MGITKNKSQTYHLDKNILLVILPVRIIENYHFQQYFLQIYSFIFFKSKVLIPSEFINLFYNYLHLETSCIIQVKSTILLYSMHAFFLFLFWMLTFQFRSLCLLPMQWPTCCSHHFMTVSSSWRNYHTFLILCPPNPSELHLQTKINE